MQTLLTRLASTYTNSFKAAAWSLKSTADSPHIEDAYLVSSKLLSICDGLGTWKTRSIDSGKFSWQLVSNIEKAHNFLSGEEKYQPNAILRNAVKETTEVGSSTCILVTIHPEKSEISCGCIGDSGMMILRKKENEVVKVGQTEEIVEKFDKPFTLGHEGVHPDKGFYATYEVMDKDIVILYSDGVSHNMCFDHIIRMVKPFMMLHEIPDLEIIAEMITEKAQSLSSDHTIETPYGTKINDSRVGKINDATVVIGEVSLRNINQ